MYVDRNPVTNRSAAFYDSEGEVAENYRAPIVENGTLTHVLTSKNTAAMFHLPVSKTAGAPYDGVPSIALAGLYLKSTAPDLKTLRRGEIAVDEVGKTSIEGVYCGGDAATGAATVIKAMGAGKVAAKAIDEYIQGK